MLSLYRTSHCYVLPHLRRFVRSLTKDTIFALSSGHGKCGVAVIRVSGCNSQSALKLITNLSELPKPRTAILRSIKNPDNKETLDKGLILWFPGPKSFTGEDSFELHVHGGIAVINSVLTVLGSIPHLRLAEPGEFTRRAFFNGKLDLTEVEGISDLLQAETEIQRKQAFLQTQGSLSKVYNKWKNMLMKCVAHVEAVIDFEETDTLEQDLLETVASDIQNLANDIHNHLSDGRKGEILRAGVKTVILGESNVGKSSLLNLLCQRPAAIVTPVEGTTRDILEVTLNIGGYPLVLADTAGLRSKTEDIVEKEGIQRALQLYKKSDLVLLVIDTDKYAKWNAVNINKSFSEYVKEYVETLKIPDLVNMKTNNLQNIFNKHCIAILNKTDLDTNGSNFSKEDNLVKISCTTEDGVADLLQNISDKLKILCGEPTEDHPSMNQLRHRQHLTDCLNCLQMALTEISCVNHNSSDFVLLAENLRKALKHLGKLVGIVTNDQLLDIIFKDFCVGK